MRGRPGATDSGDVTEHYDVIIVGTGAGGGTLAHAGPARGRAPAEPDGLNPLAGDLTHLW